MKVLLNHFHFKDKRESLVEYIDAKFGFKTNGKHPVTKIILLNNRKVYDSEITKTAPGLGIIRVMSTSYLC